MKPLPAFLAPQAADPAIPHDDPTDTFWDDLVARSNRWAPDATTMDPVTEQGLHVPERSLTAPGVGVGPDYAEGPPIESVAHKPPQHQQPAPELVSRHVVETQNVGAALVRARVVPVVGNQTPSALLEYNPNRTRALIKVITSNAIILIGPARQGGAPALTAAPTQGLAHYAQATGDPQLEIKSAAAVEAYGVQAVGGVILVSIWEEQISAND